MDENSYVRLNGIINLWGCNNLDDYLIGWNSQLPIQFNALATLVHDIIHHYTLWVLKLHLFCFSDFPLWWRKCVYRYCFSLCHDAKRSSLSVSWRREQLYGWCRWVFLRHSSGKRQLALTAFGIRLNRGEAYLCFLRIKELDANTTEFPSPIYHKPSKQTDASEIFES